MLMSGHVAATGLRDGKPFAFSESERAVLTRYASLEADGSIVLDLKGIAPRNEQDSDEVGAILVSALSAAGPPILLVGRGEQDDDLVLEESNSRIGVQVVRAMTDPGFWRDLSRTGSVSRITLTPALAADALRTAITHKASIPSAQRPRLILALDALRIPALALAAVVEEFRSTHGAWCQQLGFRAIYVVGPDPSFVARLDSLG